LLSDSNIVFLSLVPVWTFVRDIPTTQNTPVRDTRGPVDTLGRETVYWPRVGGNVSFAGPKVKELLHPLAGRDYNAI